MLSPDRNDKLIGEPPADHNALLFVEALERTLLDVVGDRRKLFQIHQANAAHQYAARIER